MNFSILKEFNVFAHNEIVMKNADCEGVMAVGRNLVLENYSVGVGYSPFECEREINSLVVGGKVKIKNSVNYNGNTCLQKNKFSNYYQMSNPSGRVVYRKLVDFNMCFEYCKNVQDLLKNQKENTVVEVCDSEKIKLKSMYNDEVMHFFIDSEVLSKTKLINIDVESRNLVFINVVGKIVDFSGLKVFVNSKERNCESTKNIFWNFINTEEIIINDIDFYGTIFSTTATLNSRNARIFGNVYTYNMYGNSDVYLCKLSSSIIRYLDRIENFDKTFNEYQLEKIENLESELVSSTKIVAENTKNISITENTQEKNTSDKVVEFLIDDYRDEKDIDLLENVTNIEILKENNKNKTLESSSKLYIQNLGKIEDSLCMLLIAEAEKYERAISLATSVEEHFQINKSVIKTLKLIKTTQTLLSERIKCIENINMLKDYV